MDGPAIHVLVAVSRYSHDDKMRNPACPSFNRATDEAAATERIAELTTLLELKYDGTALIFGVRMSPDLVAEMYVASCWRWGASTCVSPGESMRRS